MDSQGIMGGWYFRPNPAWVRCLQLVRFLAWEKGKTPTADVKHINRIIGHGRSLGIQKHIWEFKWKVYTILIPPRWAYDPLKRTRHYYYRQNLFLTLLCYCVPFVSLYRSIVQRDFPIILNLFIVAACFIHNSISPISFQ